MDTPFGDLIFTLLTTRAQLYNNLKYEYNEVRITTIGRLVADAEDLIDEIFRLEAQLASGGSFQSSNVTNVQRDIARLLNSVNDLLITPLRRKKIKSRVKR